jgi:hypothetical protein
MKRFGGLIAGTSGSVRYNFATDVSSSDSPSVIPALPAWDASVDAF